MIRNWNNLPQQADVKPLDAATGYDRVPRGNGRNYGDAAIGTEVTDMRTNRSEMRIENGCLVADSGFLLREIISFCTQNGLQFPVIPGTQYVTLGGMIAADVHGKDHVLNGTIGRWVQQLTVRLSDGTVVECSPEIESTLFRLTIGGMGSTGAILQAVIALEPIQGTALHVKTVAYSSFDALLEAWEHRHERYVVAWADGFRSDRFLLSSASWAGATSPTDLQLKGARITVPQLGIRWVRPFVMRWYNRRHFRKALKQSAIVQPEAFFFPLDTIGFWNRFYGKKGLLQWQFIVPKAAAVSTWKYVSEHLQQAGISTNLIVIKQHGALESPGLLSFPMEGFSFALDFSRTAKLETIIHQLNEHLIVVGGRVYLAKDDVLTANAFTKMYPQAEHFRQALRTLKAPPIPSALGNRLKF